MRAYVARPIRCELSFFVNKSLGVHFRFFPNRLESGGEDLLLMLHLVLSIDGFGALDIELTDLPTVTLRRFSILSNKVCMYQVSVRSACDERYCRSAALAIVCPTLLLQS